MTRLMDADDVSRALRRLAHELVEANHGAEDLVLMGIQTRGVPLAERIAEIVTDEFGVPWVRVRVCKPGAIRGARDVGVLIERTPGDRDAGD